MCVLKVASACPTLCDPVDCSLLGSSSVGFSRQEYYTGLPALLWDTKVYWEIKLDECRESHLLGGVLITSSWQH